MGSIPLIDSVTDVRNITSLALCVVALTGSVLLARRGLLILRDTVTQYEWIIKCIMAYRTMISAFVNDENSLHSLQ